MLSYEVENHLLGDRSHVEHSHNPKVCRELVFECDAVAAVNGDGGLERFQPGRSSQYLAMFANSRLRPRCRRASHARSVIAGRASRLDVRRPTSGMSNGLMRTDRLAPHLPLLDDRRSPSAKGVPSIPVHSELVKLRSVFAPYATSNPFLLRRPDLACTHNVVAEHLMALRWSSSGSRSTMSPGESTGQEPYQGVLRTTLRSRQKNLVFARNAKGGFESRFTG